MPSRLRQRWFGVGLQLKLAIAKQLAEIFQDMGIDASLKPFNGYRIQFGLSNALVLLARLARYEDDERDGLGAVWRRAQLDIDRRS
jgi:hypothetical protein